jgi:y4mF family transcriptional regulator
MDRASVDQVLGEALIPDRESVATFVRRRRAAAGMTQRALAHLVGCGVRFISELEGGKPTLRMDAVNKVLAAFGKQLGLADLDRDDEA